MDISAQNAAERTARQHDYLSRARAALLAARAIPALTATLGAESAQQTAERCLELVPGRVDEVWTLHVASDGLDLAAKLELERHLHQALAPSATTVATETLIRGVKINFRRRLGATVTKGKPAPAREAGGPVPVRGRTGAFGLAIERRAIPGVTDIVFVASGKGGVGKSTVSANLAVALARAGSRVGLLDADIYGPSAPLMLGLNGPMAVAADDRLQPLLAHGVKVASFGFLTDARQPAIWRGPLLAKAIKQLCYGVAWGDLDVLVVDLPPGTGDIQLSLIETLPVHGAIIVTTPQDVALIDAHKALTMFERLEVPVFGIVENMAGHVCSQCGHVDQVFGEGGAGRMAAARGTPVIASIPLHGAVRAAGDGGTPVALGEQGGALSRPFADLAVLLRGRLGFDTLGR